jgi:hypothetical protein
MAVVVAVELIPLEVLAVQAVVVKVELETLVQVKHQEQLILAVVAVAMVGLVHLPLQGQAVQEL